MELAIYFLIAIIIGLLVWIFFLRYMNKLQLKETKSWRRMYLDLRQEIERKDIKL